MILNYYWRRFVWHISLSHEDHQVQILHWMIVVSWFTISLLSIFWYNPIISYWPNSLPSVSFVDFLISKSSKNSQNQNWCHLLDVGWELGWWRQCLFLMRYLQNHYGYSNMVKLFLQATEITNNEIVSDKDSKAHYGITTMWGVWAFREWRLPFDHSNMAHMESCK